MTTEQTTIENIYLQLQEELTKHESISDKQQIFHKMLIHFETTHITEIQWYQVLLLCSKTDKSDLITDCVGYIIANLFINGLSQKEIEAKLTWL